MPSDVADLWYRRRADWLQRHGIDPSQRDWQVQLRQQPERIQREFHATFSREYEAFLDRGVGACVLKRPELAQLVAESLAHFHAQRYQLGDFVVMPNHVHVLVGLLGDIQIEDVCYSWKKFTATHINRALGVSGRFWQEESFDHLVRSPEEFEYLRHYIAENPRKAGLQPGEYLHRAASDAGAEERKRRTAHGVCLLLRGGSALL
jgi:REP element-mobilizing transposase RayT